MNTNGSSSDSRDASRSSIRRFFDRQLAALEADNRRRRPTQLPTELINFGSNDYLGLSNHPALVAAVQEHLAHREATWGAMASPVIGGYSSAQSRLETSLASLCHAPAAMSFTSGYAGNLGIVSALAQQGDAILSDRLNHACLIDGCRLSKAETIIYPHADAGWVEQFLSVRRHEFENLFVITESVFSMDGDTAPIVPLFRTASEHDAVLIIDEAHATGIYGNTGGGLVEHLDLPSQFVRSASSSTHDTTPCWPDNLIKLGTLSKALGCIGGFCVGSRSCIDFLVNRCRSYLFSTAAPPAALAAPLKAVQLVGQMDAERKLLLEHSVYLRSRLIDAGWNVPRGNSPIIPVIMGTEERTLALAKSLHRAGFFVPAIRPPTVPAGTSRLRISLTIRHTRAQLDGLVEALGDSLID